MSDLFSLQVPSIIAGTHASSSSSKMSLSKSGFKINPEPVSLESLRSPQVSAFTQTTALTETENAKLQERDSVASSLAGFNDIALDDDTALSPPATARPPPSGLLKKGEESPSRPASRTDDEPTGTSTGRTNSVSFSIPLESPVTNGRSHKKSTSNTTIRSSHGEFDESTFSARRASVRGSIDGQQKLQEEFARLQREEQEVASSSATTEGVIDWGAFPTTVQIMSLNEH